jgi:hypothetical protein
MLHLTFSVYYLVLILSWTNPISAVESTYSAPTATVKNGTYYGVHSSRYNQDFFFGIPYVQPPVGNLRYRAPQPLNTSWTGTRNATKISYECIGYGVRSLPTGNMLAL